ALRSLRRTRLLLVPAEVGLAAHARAGRDGQRTGLQVAGQRAGSQQLDLLRGLDVAFDFAGDDHLVGAHAAGEPGTGLDRQVALHVDVALELAGDADVAGALDLALNGQVGGDQRFLQLRRARGGGAARRVTEVVRADGGRVRRRSRDRGGGIATDLVGRLVFPDGHRGTSRGT